MLVVVVAAAAAASNSSVLIAPISSKRVSRLSFRRRMKTSLLSFDSTVAASPATLVEGFTVASVTGSPYSHPFCAKHPNTHLLVEW